MESKSLRSYWGVSHDQYLLLSGFSQEDQLSGRASQESITTISAPIRSYKNKWGHSEQKHKCKSATATGTWSKHSNVSGLKWKTAGSRRTVRDVLDFSLGFPYWRGFLCLLGYHTFIQRPQQSPVIWETVRLSGEDYKTWFSFIYLQERLGFSVLPKHKRVWSLKLNSPNTYAFYVCTSEHKYTYIHTYISTGGCRMTWLVPGYTFRPMCDSLLIWGAQWKAGWCLRVFSWIRWAWRAVVQDKLSIGLPCLLAHSFCLSVSQAAFSALTRILFGNLGRCLLIMCVPEALGDWLSRRIRSILPWRDPNYSEIYTVTFSVLVLENWQSFKICD